MPTSEDIINNPETAAILLEALEGIGLADPDNTIDERRTKLLTPLIEQLVWVAQWRPGWKRPKGWPVEFDPFFNPLPGLEWIIKGESSLQASLRNARLQFHLSTLENAGEWTAWRDEWRRTRTRLWKYHVLLWAESRQTSDPLRLGEIQKQRENCRRALKNIHDLWDLAKAEHRRWRERKGLPNKHTRRRPGYAHPLINAIEEATQGLELAPEAGRRLKAAKTQAIKFASLLPATIDLPRVGVIAKDGDVIMEFGTRGKTAIASFDGEQNFSYALFVDGQFKPGAFPGSLKTTRLPSDLIQKICGNPSA